MKKLIETFNTSTMKGVFDSIKNHFEWMTNDIALNLDIEYYLNHSGQKMTSSFYDQMIELYPNDNLSKIADVIANKFEEKWNRLYNAFILAEYNPIDNYKMNEETKTKTKITSQANSSSQSNVNGFNSDVAVNSSGGNVSATSTTEGNLDDNIIQHTKNGNIGVVTYQSLLEKEFDIRTMYNIFNVMMDDVDSLMCLLVYI